MPASTGTVVLRRLVSYFRNPIFKLVVGFSETPTTIYITAKYAVVIYLDDDSQHRKLNKLYVCMLDVVAQIKWHNRKVCRTNADLEL